MFDILTVGEFIKLENFLKKSSVSVWSTKQDDYESEIDPKNVSALNQRLYVAKIPKTKSKEEIFEEFGKLTDDLTKVIVCGSPDAKKKNRGFCFLDYESPKAASLAKQKIGVGKSKVWNRNIIVEWADPQEEPDEEVLAKVKVLFARNLTTNLKEEQLKEIFEKFGKVEQVKKIKDYAFIYFVERESAVKAMEEMNGKQFGTSTMEISFAKPESEKVKKEKILQKNNCRMIQSLRRGDSAMMDVRATPPRGRGRRVPPSVSRNHGDINGARATAGGGDYGEPPYYDEFNGKPCGYENGHNISCKPYSPALLTTKRL